jgi:hypothetical protein
MTRATSRKKLKRHGPNVWVVRRGKEFSVKEEGNTAYLVPEVRQRTAVAIARLIAKANRSELIVQDRLGRIRLRDSHGSDPFPPRG